MAATLFTIGDPLTPVLDYDLTGPSTATVGIPSDYFTVELGAGTLDDPVNITPDDGGAGGSFSVVFVTLTDGSRLATFTYTPVAAGSVTIGVTNDGGLTDPDPIILTISDPIEPDDVTHGPIVMLAPAATRWYRGGR